MTEKEQQPDSVSVVLPRVIEERQPPLANFVNVDGGGGVFTLDFFFVPEAKIERIFEGRSSTEEARVDGDTAIVESTPVARVTLPLGCACELVADLLESIVEKSPDMRDSVAELGERLTKLNDRVAMMSDRQSEPPQSSQS
jgi:hypothetical protein